MTKLWRKIKGLFIGEVRVLRPGEKSDVPMNRKQRRARMSITRKQAQRRKKHEHSKL